MPPEISDSRRLSPAALALLARRAGAGSGAGSTPAMLEQGPLSFPQLTQWFFAHLDPQSTVFNLAKILTLRGHVDEVALRRALQAIVDRHAALRTIFWLDGPEPVQRVRAARPVDLSCHDLRPIAAADRQRVVGELLEVDAGRPFDLSSDQLIRASLLRLAADEWRLQLTVHHVAFDGWSTGVLLTEFEQHYRAAVNRSDAALPPLQSQVPDAAAWQRAQLDTPAFARDHRYWRERLRGAHPLDVPVDHPGTAVPRHRGGQRRLRLTSSQWASVLACARAHACTPFAVTFAAWAVLTARRCNQTKCLLGVTLAGRTRAEWEPLIGNFADVLPLLVDLDDAPTFAALLAQVTQRTGEALEHQHFPFQQLAAEIAPARRAGREPLFPVVFNFRNVPLRLPQDLPDVEVIELTMPLRGTVALLGLNVTPDRGGALVELDFDPDQIDVATAERWLRAYAAILDAALDTPGTSVLTLPVMASAEQIQLDVWNKTDRPRDRELTLTALLARQALATPDRIAVTAADAEWSYRTLAENAHRLAGVLRGRGIGPGSLVGVCMERCAGLVAALLAVLEAGAAYVPIDASYPTRRIIRMLGDTGAAVVITGPGTPNDLTDSRWELIAWDAPDTNSRTQTPTRAVTATDPAFVIFTSGSSGQPKGVVIAHSNIVNYFEWAHARYQLRRDDAMIQMASISVDRAVWECWLALLTGGRLVLPARDDHRDPGALVELIARERVSVLGVVPSMLRALLDTGRLGAATALRLVSCGGEAMTRDLIADFQAAHAATLLNEYGPTETCIISTCWETGANAATGPVPIGQPIANTRAHVLDPRGEVVPIGVPGELYLAGDGVARGYLNRPELTVERFLRDRFRAATGGRMYRTGDRARWRHDGLLEYLGRLDSQVKVRGFRVELGEVEAALGRVPGVRIAVAVPQSGPGGDARLVAFVEPVASVALDPAAVRAALTQELPDQMIPSRIEVRASLPIAPSGKIDRVALAASMDTAAGRPASAAAHAAPRSILERALAANWERLLGVSTIGLDDDFFLLGGHSLIAARMVNELERDTGHRVPLATLFRASTIRALAAAMLEPMYPSDGTSVHPVQVGGSQRPPFFMLTGDVVGAGFYCRGLAKALDAEQALYAIPPIRPSSDSRLLTIAGMAAAHLADIRRVQPTGPYRLGGFCAAGLIAYEIARQLQAGGQEVDLLLLVDSIAPREGNALLRALAWAAGRLRSGEPAARLTRHSYVTQRMTELATLPPGRRVATLAGYPVRLVRRALGRSGSGAATAVRESAAASETDPVMTATLEFHGRAQEVYRHGVYSGRVDLVRSRDPERPLAQQVAAWRRVARDVVPHDAQSDHDRVVFDDLPEILRVQLERVNLRKPEE